MVEKIFWKSLFCGVKIIEDEQNVLKKHKADLLTKEMDLEAKDKTANPWKLIHIKSDIAICNEHITKLNKMQKKVESIQQWIPKIFK